MKKLMNIVSFLLIFGIVYFAITNNTEIITLHILNSQETANSIGIPNLSKSVNLLYYTLIVLGIGIFASLCWIAQFYFAQKENLNVYKRELEKNSISNLTSTSKVEVLEAKIATLEKALDEALKK